MNNQLFFFFISISQYLSLQCFNHHATDDTSLGFLPSFLDHFKCIIPHCIHFVEGVFLHPMLSGFHSVVLDEFL